MTQMGQKSCMLPAMRQVAIQSTLQITLVRSQLAQRPPKARPIAAAVCGSAELCGAGWGASLRAGRSLTRTPSR